MFFWTTILSPVEMFKVYENQELKYKSERLVKFCSDLTILLAENAEFGLKV